MFGSRLRWLVFVGAGFLLMFGGGFVAAAQAAPQAATSCFSDVNTGDWFEPFVCWMYDNGLTVGYPDGTFRPLNNITRAEVSVFIKDVHEMGHWGETWTGSGTGLTLSGGTVGLSGSGAFYGVRGEATGTDSYDTGVYGWNSSTTGFVMGVQGDTHSPGGVGVYGRALGSTGHNVGVSGISNSVQGYGVAGMAYATSGSGEGVYGETSSPSGYGVVGASTSTTGTNYGVYGTTSSSNGYGVYGSATSGTAVFGESTYPDSSAVVGVSSATTGSGIGVFGLGNSSSGWAGYFLGNVDVVGTLSKSAGSFKIDDPLDPANKYLYHSFVESPDMMDVYNGVVSLDDNGQATVHMPDYFQALNQDYRYQLTAIGAAMPNLHVSQKISDNAFKIAGGAAGLEVSWEVTGIRHDPYANDHRIPVEQAKPADEQGTYLYPKGYSQSASKGVENLFRLSPASSSPQAPAAVEAPSN